MNLSKASPLAGAWKSWKPLCIIGVLAVAAGVMIPQMLPGNATAAEAAPAPATAKPATGQLKYHAAAGAPALDPKKMLVRLGVGTVLVLGLCVGTLVVGKRWLGRMPAKANGQQRLQLVESLALGNRCCVHLVRIEQQQVLIGVDASGMKSMLPIAEPFESALNAAREELENAAGSNYSALGKAA